MPDAKRMQILAGMVTTLAGINGGGTYNNNLTAADQVTLNAGAGADQWRGYSRWIWVHEGDETTDIDTPAASSPLMLESQLTLLLDAVIRDITADILIKETNALLHDIRLRLMNNISLGGVCFTAQIFSVDQPVYDLDEKIAMMRVRVRVTYFYDAVAV